MHKGRYAATLLLFLIAFLYILPCDASESNQPTCLSRQISNSSRYDGRVFIGYTLNLTETVANASESHIFACRQLCKYNMDCKAITYKENSTDIFNCKLYNSTDSARRIIKDANSTVILFLPENCTKESQGEWTAWSTRHDNMLPTNECKATKKRNCQESSSGCLNAVCEGTSMQFVTETTIDASQLNDITESGLGCFTTAQGTFPILADVDAAGTAWIVIQHRFNGATDFYRNWQSYKDGFGDVDGEFWLGNDNIHELTKNGDMKIRFDLFDGTEERYAEYDSFSISDESDNYRLTLGSYSGTAGNSFERQNGHQFTTKDNDHDSYGNNCAVLHGGAWWYQICMDSNLNGAYLNGTTTGQGQGMVWKAWKGLFFSMIETTMKISLI